MKTNLSKVMLSLFFIAIFLSCNRNRGATALQPVDECNLKTNSIRVSILDSCKKGNTPSISPDLNYAKPKNDSILREWQKKVYDDGDEYYYDQLVYYYDEHSELRDEMIKYTEIMINKVDNNDLYILSYYKYVVESKHSDKVVLMKKIIKYLWSLLKSKNRYVNFQARNFLSEIYKDGIYVEKDSIIAKYLEDGGCNLDSIIRTRSINR
jgi:hypothetical protein